jgi:hypothetical protein
MASETENAGDAVPEMKEAPKGVGMVLSNETETGRFLRAAANLSVEEWSDSRITTLMRTVGHAEATLSDVAMFLTVAKRYDLDPFMKQIWLAKMDGKLVVVTGRDGLMVAASRDPGYMGYEAGVVYEKDSFELVRNGNDVSVKHTINGFDRGKPVGLYCVVPHAHRSTVAVVRPWTYYQKLLNDTKRKAWVDYPEDMGENRVVVAALRRQYPLASIVADVELDEINRRPPPTDSPGYDPEESDEVKARTQETISRLRARVQQVVQGDPEEEEEQPAVVVEEGPPQIDLMKALKDSLASSWPEATHDTWEEADAPPAPEGIDDEPLPKVDPSSHIAGWPAVDQKRARHYFARWRDRQEQGWPEGRRAFQSRVIKLESFTEWSPKHLELALRVMEDEDEAGHPGIGDDLPFV